MRNWYFVLDEQGEPLEVDDLFVWGAWFEHADRIVARDTIDGLTVSTVFLGINHRFVSEGPPVLWETMIFREDENAPHTFDDFQVRYSSREEAIGGHTLACEMVRSRDRRTAHTA